jgi:hypothetical protein
MPIKTYWSPLALISWRSTFFCFFATNDYASSSSSRSVRMPTIKRSCNSMQPRPTREGEGANRAAVDASQARGGADADAFTKRGNDFNLLFAGENVHEGAIL